MRCGPLLAIVAAGLLGACTSTEPGIPVAGTPSTDREPLNPRRRVLDEAALEGDNGVRKVLVQNYGIPADQIENVDCPANENVKPGNVFTCEVLIGGKLQVVDIKVRSEQGEYEVGTPRDK